MMFGGECPSSAQRTAVDFKGETSVQQHEELSELYWIFMVLSMHQVHNVQQV